MYHLSRRTHTNLLDSYIFSRVDVADTLSENTVWVIQQFFSNLLSAACIPVFKALRDASALRLPMFKTLSEALDSAPDFTYSFYLLVMIHALATIYFASFSAQYLRHEDREEEERRKKGNEQTPPLDREFGGAIIYPKPKPPLRKDQPWKKKYPFLIPQRAT